MDAVGRLVGHDNLGLNRPEELSHLVLSITNSDTGLVLHNIPLRDSRRPNICAAITTDTKILQLIPLQVQVVFMKGSKLQIHVIVPRQVKAAGVLLHGSHILENFVLLLHDPASANSVLLIAGPFILNFLIDIGIFQKAINKIFDENSFFLHLSPQTMKIGLQVIVTNGRFHVVEGDVNQVPGNDVNIGDRLGEEVLQLLEITVDISYINHLHYR